MRTIKTCTNKDAVNRLCETVEALADQNRRVIAMLLEQQTRTLDRALAVADYGLRVKAMESESERISERPANPRVRDEYRPDTRLNGAMPDILVGDPDPNSPVG